MSLNLIPSPSRVSPAVLAAQADHPLLPPNRLISSLEARMREILFPEASSMIFFSGSREACWEVLINSLMHGRSLVCVSGRESRRFSSLCRALNLDFEIFESAFGKELLEAEFERDLTENSFDAVFLNEIEPYNGVMLDIRHFADIIRRKNPDALIIVDQTSSITAVRPLKIGEHADVVLFSSEQALGLPPGLGVILLSERANFKTIGDPGEGWALNFTKIHQQIHETGSHTILPTPLLHALNKQFDRIFLEGLQNRVQRIETLSVKMKAWAEKNLFQVVGEEGMIAPTVTVMKVPARFSLQQLKDGLEPYGLVFGEEPNEQRSDKAIIAHMNDTSEDELDYLIELLERFLADYDVQRGIPVSARPIA